MGGFSINLVLISIWALLGRVFIKDTCQREKLFLIISFIQLLILNIIRNYTVGQDIPAYQIAFEQISTRGLSSITSFEWEPGYVILNFVIGKCGFSFRCLLVIIAVFSYYSIFRFIKRYSKEYWLSVILFIVLGFYFATYHILRQTVALSIILFSYDAIIKRNTKKFVLLVIIATLFHFTAIFFLFTYFLWSHKRISLFKFSVIFLISFAVGNILIKILLNSAFGVIARYETYAVGSLEGEGYGMLLLLLMLTISGLLLPAKKLSRQEILIYLLVVIATCLQSFTTAFSLFARICWYWNFALIAYIPMCINLTNNKKSKTILNICITFLAAIFFFTSTNINENKEVYATYKIME